MAGDPKPSKSSIEIGKRIKALCAKRFKNKSECARQLDILPQNWTKIETGKVKFDSEEIFRFADFFGVDAGWLLTGHESPSDAAPAAPGAAPASLKAKKAAAAADREPFMFHWDKLDTFYNTAGVHFDAYQNVAFCLMHFFYWDNKADILTHEKALGLKRGDGEGDLTLEAAMELRRLWRDRVYDGAREIDEKHNPSVLQFPYDPRNFPADR